MSYKQFFVNETVFDKMDNQNSAYFLGLLYADGTNYENGVIKIDLVEQDLETLESFKKFLNYTGEIKHYKGENKLIGGSYYDCQPTCRLSIRSKHISENLSKFGCTSNKTYTLMFPSGDIVPENLIRHFIRGYMDGDGGISYWIDNENTGHKKFQIHFCGTTDMINNIAKILSEKFNCCPAITDRYEERNNNNLQFNICGNLVVRKILDWLYDDSEVKMKRKYDKYLELVEENKRVENDSNLYGSAYERRKVINLNTKEVYNSCADAKNKMNLGAVSQVTFRCQKHQGLMYFDDYEKIEDKDSIISNELNYSGMAKKVYCFENFKTYSSISEASRKLGVSVRTIKNQCSGIETKEKTYTFKFI